MFCFFAKSWAKRYDNNKELLLLKMQSFVIWKLYKFIEFPLRFKHKNTIELIESNLVCLRN